MDAETGQQIRTLRAEDTAPPTFDGSSLYCGFNIEIDGEVAGVGAINNADSGLDSVCPIYAQSTSFRSLDLMNQVPGVTGHINSIVFADSDPQNHRSSDLRY